MKSQNLNAGTIQESTINAPSIFANFNSVEFWKEAEFSRIAVTPMILISIVCLNAIAMAFGSFPFDVRLILTAGTGMTLLVAILALLPMKFIVRVSILSVILDIVLLTATLF